MSMPDKSHMAGVLNAVTHADCIAFLATLPDACVDSVVTDPPYEIGFMGRKWDKTGIANSVEMWAAVLRVLKPGGHLLAFAATRTYHRMTCAIEDAGFEVRDQIGWLYGSGFPKSIDVSKAIDKAARHERNPAEHKRKAREQWRFEDQHTPSLPPVTPEAARWEGWGTALKPAWEPLCLARKPLCGTVADNVQERGTGALNIDGCRVPSAGVGDYDHDRNSMTVAAHAGFEGKSFAMGARSMTPPNSQGRFPSNVIHDGGEEVMEAFATFGEKTSNSGNLTHKKQASGFAFGKYNACVSRGITDTGSAARFFYAAKASRAERGANNDHPTVKPLALMRYLVRLITPPGGIVLDHFAGSGTTLVAARQEGFAFIGCDADARHCEIARSRLERDLHFAGASPRTI